MNTGLKIELETIIVAYPRDGITVDQLAQKMKELGNVVLEQRDDCLLMVQQKQTALEMKRG